MLLLLALSPCALALNPSLDINQYAHTAWTIRDGFFGSGIQSIAQTPDGYLWLGTSLGLLRFDGVRKVSWEPPAGEHLPSTDVGSLLVTRDGRLWIGTSAGLVSWKDERLVHYPALAGQFVGALLEDRRGTVWVGGTGIPAGRLCAIERGAVECFGQDGGFGRAVLSLFEENGNLWVGAESGLWRWQPGPPRRFAMPVQERIRGFSKVRDGPLLIATTRGMRQLASEKLEAYPIRGAEQPLDAYLFLRDRDDGLWIATLGRGLLHLHRGVTDSFTQRDGLSGDLVLGLFEDREGNVWVATRQGLDRFRDFAVPTLTPKQGLSKDDISSVLAGRDGTVWLGAGRGLNRWERGKITIYRKPDGLPDYGANSLFEDDRGRIWVSTLRGIAFFENGGFAALRAVSSSIVYNIVQVGDGDFWINDQDHGLLHVRGEQVVDRVAWASLSRQVHATALAFDPVRCGLWLGFYTGGVAFFKDGKIQASYATTGEPLPRQVTQLQVRPDGSVWVATTGGLSRITGGHVATLNARNGLPCDAVNWMIEDDDHSAWLYMPCGLVRIDQANLNTWIADPNRPVRNTVFDGSDGVSYRNDAGFSPHVSKSSDGRLWFPTLNGVGIIDPHHLAFNKLPPPVHIESVKADGKTYAVKPGLRLPALVRDLWIDYTAVSLVAPEKTHFKYKLEGQDRDWKEVVNDREAQYTNLGPRSYRFRVMASNNSGVWNETGDMLEFSIAPAYYQTNWFRALMAAVVLAMLWGLYRLRLLQIAREFDAHLEGRVNERMRMARDLHDTLLQSFHGLLPRFQAVQNLLPGRVTEAKQVLESALDDAGKAITEARDAVQGMRVSTVLTNDLAKALETFGEEMAAHHAAETAAENGAGANENAAVFSVEVEGAPQELHPILRDEIYRIAAEALRNAFHHAQAQRIEVELRYSTSELRVRVRDDGAGIDPSILGQKGRAGHFGLKGMRERAEQIGGKLEVWSERGAGTEIELTLPASVAYGRKGGWRSRFLTRKFAEKS